MEPTEPSDLYGKSEGASERQRAGQRPYISFSPVNRSNASTYLADVFAITSFGSDGAGGVLS